MKPPGRSRPDEKGFNMSRLSIAIAVAALFPLAAMAADVAPHTVYTGSVATYKAGQGFTQTVGSRHFVGFFLKNGDACAVTVVDAAVGDDRLREAPRRQKIDIAAGGRAEVASDNGKALGIGCTAEADAIKIDALEPRNTRSASR